ncbi:hypothetical protein ACWD4F_30915 [Streptomyces aureus]
MTEAQCQNQKPCDRTATDECRAVWELLADQKLKAHAAEAASMVPAHVATCDARRDRHGRAAVPAHLFLLRDALARDEDQLTQACAATRGRRGHASPAGRRPFRSAGTMSITLSQWVSRTTSSVN